jgi:hypothetical protein
MFYLVCPGCGSPVEIPDNAVGPNRTDPWNICRCEICGLSFDYEDAEVRIDDEPG